MRWDRAVSRDSEKKRKQCEREENRTFHLQSSSGNSCDYSLMSLAANRWLILLLGEASGAWVMSWPSETESQQEKRADEVDEVSWLELIRNAKVCREVLRVRMTNREVTEQLEEFKCLLKLTCNLCGVEWESLRFCEKIDVSQLEALKNLMKLRELPRIIVECHSCPASLFNFQVKPLNEPEWSSQVVWVL